MPRESVSFSMYFTYDKEDYPNMTEDEFEQLVLTAVSQNTDLKIGEVRASQIGRGHPPWVDQPDESGGNSGRGSGRGP